MPSQKKIFKPGPPQKRKKKNLGAIVKQQSSFLSKTNTKMKEIEVLMKNAEKEYYHKEIKLEQIRFAARELIKAGKPGESYNTYCSTIIIYEKEMKESLYKLNLMKYKYFHVQAKE